MKLKDLFEIRVPSLGYASNHEVVKNYSGGNLDLIRSHVLGLTLIKGLVEISTDKKS